MKNNKRENFREWEEPHQKYNSIETHTSISKTRSIFLLSFPKSTARHKNIEHSNTSYIRSFFEHNFNENIHCSLLFHIEPFNPGENMKNAKHESKDVKILDSSSDESDFDGKTKSDEILKCITG